VQLNLIQSTTETGELVFTPEWDTPRPDGAGRRQMSEAFPSTFFYNESLGFVGQLEEQLEQVRNNWNVDLNGSDVQTVQAVWPITAYESSLGLVQLGFFAVLPMT